MSETEELLRTFIPNFRTDQFDEYEEYNVLDIKNEGKKLCWHRLGYINT